MTGVLVPSLVPSLALSPRAERARSPRSGPRRPLPVAPLIGARQRTTVYGLTAVDARGRVADHVIVRALGWQPGTALTIRLAGGLITVSSAAEGEIAVSSQGRVHLPAAVRHACGITAGDRVLLAADPGKGVLVVHPPAALDAALAQPNEPTRAGDAP